MCWEVNQSGSNCSNASLSAPGMVIIKWALNILWQINFIPLQFATDRRLGIGAFNEVIAMITDFVVFEKP